MNIYEKYYLKDNPFPTTPILDPGSDDDRVNGKIYNPHIREAEIHSFESKIRQRPPLIYIENSEFERGVGKSALLVQQWRQLQAQADVTSIYIRSTERLKPADFAARVIERWHHEGHLWLVVLQMLAMYVKENPHGEMPSAGFSLFKEKQPKLPKRLIPLSSFNVFNPKRLTGDLAILVHEKTGDYLSLDLAKLFFETYLTEPDKFLQSYPSVLHKQKADNIAMLAGVYRLLRMGNYQYHYLFFDQFEDVVHGLTGKALITFNTEMRRLIEASMGQATITVTLHPGATQALSTHEGGDIRSIAPLDSRSVVDVRHLTKVGAHQLALTYLNHYRLPNTAQTDPLYPFTLDAVNAIHTASQGNIRACLQAFNYAIVCGMDANCALIDQDFLTQHHTEITGRIHPEHINL
jgi:hypothetical protein